MIIQNAAFNEQYAFKPYKCIKKWLTKLGIVIGKNQSEVKQLLR
jgi:hypothetical protein